MKTASLVFEFVLACLYALFYLPILPLKLAQRYWGKFRTKDGLFALLVAEVSYSLIGWSLIVRMFF